MKGCLGTSLFILFFPVTIPIWLWKKGAMGKAGAFLFMFVFSVIIGTIPTPEEREAAAKATEIALSMPTPVSTPTPTQLPPTLAPTSVLAQPVALVSTPSSPAVSPTSAPSPTLVPSPTFTPTPNFSSYLEELLPIFTELENAGNAMSLLFASARVTENEWIIAVAAQLAVVRLRYDDLKAITPPAQMANVHQSLVDAFSYCDNATYLIAQGVDNRDTSALQSGTNLWVNCQERLDQIKPEIQRVVGGL